MGERTVRVMVVDDHTVVRAALAGLVGAATDMVVCAQAATIDEAEAVAHIAEPDVVIVDLHLSDGTGISASRRIRNHRPATQVVLLTAASDHDALYASILAAPPHTCPSSSGAPTWWARSAPCPPAPGCSTPSWWPTWSPARARGGCWRCWPRGAPTPASSGSSA